MKLMFRLLVALAMANVVAGSALHAQNAHTQTGEKIMKQAKGSFTVKITPAESTAIGKEAGIALMTIDKVIEGELAGTTKGEMMATSTESTGAMAYVAIETVTATLNGRSGTFVFIHNATMNKNDPKSAALHIDVVPGSGTGGLAGISGRFDVHIDAAGKHSYTFDYQLP